MTLPITPRSRTLAALSVARGTYRDSIELQRWHALFSLFIISWFVLYITFDSFHPTSLLSDSDIEDDQSTLTDSGRAMIYGASLGFAVLIAFIFYFFNVSSMSN